MENQNQKIKSIEDLNRRPWYRAIKAIYVLSVTLTLVLLLFNVVYGEDAEELLIFAGILVIIALIARGTFYYIVLGKINPER